MLRSQFARPGYERALPALQVMGLALLSLMLIPAFSGSKGLLLPGALFGFCGLLLLLFRPDFGVLVILLSWFVQLPPFLGVAFLSIPYTVAAVLLVPLLLTMHKDRGLWIRKVPAVRFYLAIAVCFILSTWWNQLERPILPELDQ